MEKALKLAVLLAVSLSPSPLCAKDGGGEARAAAASSQAQQVSTAPYARQGLGKGAGTEPGAQAGALLSKKRKPIRELVDTMAPPEFAKMTVTTLKVLDGTADKKSAYKFSIPKGVRWRVLWEFVSTSAKERGQLKIRVDSPRYKDFYQELIKEVGISEDPYGVMNICETGEGDFNLTIDSRDAKWHIEVQQLK